MKKIIFAFLGICLLSQISFAKVSTNDLREIDDLIFEKKYSEALEAHKKFFEESKSASGLGGVRLSFALASWAKLGRLYTPANEALTNIAENLKTKIYSGSGDFDIFQEYEAINSYINKNEETLKAFKLVASKYPEQVNSFYLVVRRVLIEEEQFNLIKKYENDPIYEYETSRHQREYALSQLRKKNLGYKLDSINSTFEEQVKKLIEITEKIGYQEEANEIKNRYENYFNGNLIKKYH